MAQDKMLAQAKAPRATFADRFRRKPDPDEEALVLNLPSVMDGMALSGCSGSAVKIIDGRRACNVPLWLDPPDLVLNSRASHPSWQNAAASGATTGEQSDDWQRGRGAWGFGVCWERSL